MSKLEEQRAQREQWFRSIATHSQFYRLLDYLEDVSFFAKDTEGNLMAETCHGEYGWRTAREREAGTSPQGAQRLPVRRSRYCTGRWRVVVAHLARRTLILESWWH